MMRLVWILLLVACEKAAEPPRRPPADARVPVDAPTKRDREDELDVRVKALDRLRERLATIKRERSPVEAPVALTDAYVAYQLAYGYARLERPDRARALVAGARRGLADVATDPVHGYLTAAFEARIDQAIANQHPAAPLPEPVLARFAALDRIGRYKVDRFREVSSIIAATENPDAIGAFAKRMPDRRAEITAIRAIADPAARAKQIAQLPDVAARFAVDDRPAVLEGCLDLATQLAKPDAISVLSRVRQLIDTVPDAYRAQLYVKLLVIADYHGLADVSSIAIAGIRDVAPFWGPNARPLFETARMLRRAGKHQELAGLLARVEPAVTKAPLGLRAVWAGALAHGDANRARPVFDEAHATLAGPLTLTARLDLVRAVALGYASAPVDLAIRGVDRLTDGFGAATDSYGTNTHYARSVIDYVESLVLGLL
jgi:hypothetical protein